MPCYRDYDNRPNRHMWMSIECHVNWGSIRSCTVTTTLSYKVLCCVTSMLGVSIFRLFMLLLSTPFPRPSCPYPCPLRRPAPFEMQLRADGDVGTLRVAVNAGLARHAAMGGIVCPYMGIRHDRMTIYGYNAWLALSSPGLLSGLRVRVVTMDAGLRDLNVLLLLPQQGIVLSLHDPLSPRCS